MADNTGIENVNDDDHLADEALDRTSGGKLHILSGPVGMSAACNKGGA
jgi:hypothetical protein